MPSKHRSTSTQHEASGNQSGLRGEDHVPHNHRLNGHEQQHGDGCSGQYPHTVIGGLAQSDCLIVIPEGVARINAGDSVDVIDLRGDIR